MNSLECCHYDLSFHTFITLFCLTLAFVVLFKLIKVNPPNFPLFVEEALVVSYLTMPYYVLFQLIKVNQPDLCLFVGEALVGNEAVDQLTKFNQALADHSNMTNPRLIDGIILTKFDTIDDKVGHKASRS